MVTVNVKREDMRTMLSTEYQGEISSKLTEGIIAPILIVADKRFSLRVLKLECRVVVAELDFYGYDDIGEGAMSNERLATLLDV